MWSFQHGSFVYVRSVTNSVTEADVQCRPLTDDLRRDVNTFAWSPSQWRSSATPQPDVSWCDWCHKCVCDTRLRPGVLQAGSDSLSVSERPRTTVPVGLLRPGHQCWHSAASALRQPSTTCSTSLPAQHLRLSGLFSCRPHSLELSPGFYPGPDHQCRLF